LSDALGRGRKAAACHRGRGRAVVPLHAAAPPSADTLAYDLPRTVRESAIRAVMQIRSWRHRAASNRAVVQEKDGQFSVVCSIADMGSDVFRMELAMPDKLTAEMIKNNFIAHGSDIFPKLLNALTQPGSEDDRPPAGLM